MTKMTEVFRPKSPPGIIVTIPRSRQKAVEAEEREVADRLAAGETGITYYWQMGRLPAQKFERIYFVWDGAIRAYHDVLSVDEATSRIILDPKINEITPIPMSPFRGFRYL